MRIWHYKLLPFLPDSLLLTLWDDLVRIAEGDRDLFTQFITEDEQESLFFYTMRVNVLLTRRNLKPKEELKDFVLTHYKELLNKDSAERIGQYKCFENDHDFFYLAFCVSLLNEYYALGLTGYSDEMHGAMIDFIEKEMNDIVIPFKMKFDGFDEDDDDEEEEFYKA